MKIVPRTGKYKTFQTVPENSNEIIAVSIFACILEWIFAVLSAVYLNWIGYKHTVYDLLVCLVCIPSHHNPNLLDLQTNTKTQG